MMDGPKLPARDSNVKAAQNQVYSDISHEQKPQISITNISSIQESTNLSL